MHEQPDLAEHILSARMTEEVELRNVVINCADSSAKLEVIGLNTELDDGLKENKCLTNLVGGKEQYSWRGPLLVLGLCG